MLYNLNALKLVRFFQLLIIQLVNNPIHFFFFFSADISVLTSNQKKCYLAALLEFFIFYF